RSSWYTASPPTRTRVASTAISPSPWLTGRRDAGLRPAEPWPLQRDHGDHHLPLLLLEHQRVGDLAAPAHLLTRLQRSSPPASAVVPRSSTPHATPLLPARELATTSSASRRIWR